MTPDRHPVILTDEQIDAVSGGQIAAHNLVSVQVSNVLNNSLDNLDIAVNANALNSAPNAFHQL